MTTAADGITITANDVTVDFCGYKVTGMDSGSSAGINVHGCDRTEIRNGSITGFHEGIYESVAGHKDMRIIGMKLFSNDSGIIITSTGAFIKDCLVENSPNSGIDYAGSYGIITGNVVRQNGNGIEITVGISATVSGNVSSGNTLGAGIHVPAGSSVLNNTATDNKYGIIASAGNCLVNNNTCYNNNVTNLSTVGTDIVGVNLAP
jgi:parallel beta-helix repeat protein